MTILEALKSTVAKYPLSDNTFNRVLIDRELSATADYTKKTSDFELATADLLKVLITAPNLSEGGVTITLSEKTELKKLANIIYRQYGEPAIGEVRTPRGRSNQTW